MADTVLVIDDGGVAQIGPPADVAARPLTEHVARLVGLNVLRDGSHLTSFRPDAVTVSLARPEGSARLQWPGRVLSTAPHGDVLRARVETVDGATLLADITPAAAVELGLAAGREVWLSVKATSVQTYSAA
ncbi:MAG: TOBE domain-containing protein [Nocardioides sp.]